MLGDIGSMGGHLYYMRVSLKHECQTQSFLLHHCHEEQSVGRPRDVVNGEGGHCLE